MRLQTPYEAISEEEYAHLAAAMPAALDWAAFQKVERGARRDAAAGRELACAAGACDLAGDAVGASGSSADEAPPV